MKQVKNIVFLILLAIYLVVVSGFINSKESVQKIGSIKVRVVDSTENMFIRSADIRQLFEQKNIRVFGKNTADINAEALEKSLYSLRIIDRAEVFITEPGVLHVEISQKTPFVRVFNRYGEGYYLDRKGNIIPTTRSFSPYVLVASGFIAEPFAISKTDNIFDVSSDSLKRSLHTIYDVYKVARFISADDFWNAQIAQIYVNSQLEFELIPRVGAHIIELGFADNLDEKFENLEILYHRGFNKLGWNQYEKISLKYKNQVVCTKIQ